MDAHWVETTYFRNKQSPCSHDYPFRMANVVLYELSVLENAHVHTR